LVSKYAPADLYAVELDANGVAPNPTNLVLVTTWDGAWPEYTPAIASNGADRQALAVAVQTSGGRAVLIQTGSSASATARKADFSSDGKADIVWQNDDGHLSIWTMNGSTMMSSPPINPGLVDANWRIAATGDFNGDGKADLIWQDAGGWLAVWYMNGQTMVGSQLLTPGQVADRGWQIVGTGDFNGDGRTDLVWQHTDGWLAVWYMNGSAMIATELLNPGQIVGNEWRIVGVGDFNGDSKPDLVWQHTSGWLSVWYMNGRNMVSAVYMNPSQVADTDWKIRAVTDLNGDGKTDLIWQHMTGGWLSVWVMDGISANAMLYLSPSSVFGGWKIMGPR